MHGVRPVWLDGRPRIGIHTSTAGEASRALDIAARIGCTALQIFSGSPRMWPREHQRMVNPAVAKRFRQRRAALRLGPVAVHANYLINLASPDPMVWERSVAAFRDEILRAQQLGAEYLIVHPGSPRDAGIHRGIESVAEAIARASRGTGIPARGTDILVCPSSATSAGIAPASSRTGTSACPIPASSVRILIENTAGHGTGLGSDFTHLRAMLAACRARGVTPEPGICLDTAHLLAAGFEIRTPEGLDRTLAEADSAFGLDNVRVVHMNDSKVPLGARRDRHEHIGRGHIGKAAFARILAHPKLQSPERAFLAETPIDRPGDDRRNVRALWTLLGLDPPVQKHVRVPASRLDMSRPARGAAARLARKRPAPASPKRASVGARHPVPRPSAPPAVRHSRTHAHSARRAHRTTSRRTR
jgi:deoxyribonuclease-4